MTTATTLRDPGAETGSSLRPRREPLESLADKTVALLDIGKMRGDEYIDRLERLFNDAGVATIREKKPTNTRVAPAEIIQRIVTKAHAVVIALSDCGSCTSCSTHDLATLDGLGLPGVNVITEEFMEAFEVQRTSIGFDGVRVVVPHPMQNRTRTELEALADKSFSNIVAAISKTELD